jgi:hypothetical protein
VTAATRGVGPSLFGHPPGAVDGVERYPVIVELATVARWHQEVFKRFWRRRSSSGRPGRPGLNVEVVKLIRRMPQANVTWGAPRIRNELAMLGIEVAVSTVAKYMPRRRKPPSPTWRAFLENHLRDLVAIDFFDGGGGPRTDLRLRAGSSGAAT